MNMRIRLASVVLFFCFNNSLFAEEDLGFKPFHPTDALLIGGNGQFNQGAEYQEPVAEVTGQEPVAEVTGEVKPFHPTDALLIGGNGPFNPGSEYSEGK